MAGKVAAKVEPSFVAQFLDGVPRELVGRGSSGEGQSPSEQGNTSWQLLSCVSDWSWPVPPLGTNGAAGQSPVPGPNLEQESRGPGVCVIPQDPHCLHSDQRACMCVCACAGGQEPRIVHCQLQDEERRRQQQLEEMRQREVDDRARLDEERRQQEEERGRRDAEEKVLVL